MKIVKLGINPNTEYYFQCKTCDTIYVATEKELRTSKQPNHCPNCGSAVVAKYTPTAEEVAEWSNERPAVYAVPINKTSTTPEEVSVLKRAQLKKKTTKKTPCPYCWSATSLTVETGKDPVRKAYSLCAKTGKRCTSKTGEECNTGEEFYK